MTKTFEVAVIINHPFRDNDYRVDLYDIPSEYEDRPDYIKAFLQSRMLGHFQIVSVTSRISRNIFEGSQENLKQYDDWLLKKEKDL